MNLERPGAQEALTLKPQHIESLRGDRVEFLPQRGGIVTNVKLRGREVLYMDPATLIDPTKNVRGGIPILFPNAGKITENPLYPGLAQHGFARTSSKWTHDIGPEKDSFVEYFHSNEETLRQYPYKFLLEVSGALRDEAFVLTQQVQNFSERDMPVAMGLHPYFKIDHAKKSDLKFEFSGGEVFEEKKDEWMQGEAVFIDNPKKWAPNADMKVRIPDLGTLVLEASDKYQKIVLWSQPQQNFVCIEPWMRSPEGLVEDPCHLPPNDILSAWFSMKLER